MYDFPPDEPDFWRRSVDPPPAKFRTRIRLAWSVLCGGSVVHRAKFGVQDGKLWLIQRKDKAPTRAYGVAVYNTDTFQDRLMVSGPNWVSTHKEV